MNNNKLIPINPLKTPKMNTTLALNDLESKLLQMKNNISSLMYDIEYALEEIHNIKETLDPYKMFQGIPICEQ